MKKFYIFCEDEKATATIEFVLVLPLYLLLIWALMTLGGKSVASIRSPLAARFAAWSASAPAASDIVENAFPGNSDILITNITRTEEDVLSGSGDITGFLGDAGTQPSYWLYINNRNLNSFSDQIYNALSGFGTRVTVQVDMTYQPWSADQASAGQQGYTPELSAKHTVTLYTGTDRTLLSNSGSGSFINYLQNNMSDYQAMPKGDDTSRFWTDE